MPLGTGAAVDRVRAAGGDLLRTVADEETLVGCLLFDCDRLAAAAERALMETLVPATVAVEAAFAIAWSSQTSTTWAPVCPRQAS